MEKENYQMHGQASQDYFIERKGARRIYMVGEETDEETHDLKTRQCMAR